MNEMYAFYGYRTHLPPIYFETYDDLIYDFYHESL